MEYYFDALNQITSNKIDQYSLNELFTNILIVVFNEKYQHKVIVEEVMRGEDAIGKVHKLKGLNQNLVSQIVVWQYNFDELNGMIK